MLANLLTNTFQGLLPELLFPHDGPNEPAKCKAFLLKEVKFTIKNCNFLISFRYKTGPYAEYLNSFVSRA